MFRLRYIRNAIGILFLTLAGVCTHIYYRRGEEPFGELTHPIHFFGVRHYGTMLEQRIFLLTAGVMVVYVIICVVCKYKKND